MSFYEIEYQILRSQFEDQQLAQMKAIETHSTPLFVEFLNMTIKIGIKLESVILDFQKLIKENNRLGKMFDYYFGKAGTVAFLKWDKEMIRFHLKSLVKHRDKIMLAKTGIKKVAKFYWVDIAFQALDEGVIELSKDNPNFFDWVTRTFRNFNYAKALFEFIIVSAGVYAFGTVAAMAGTAALPVLLAILISLVVGYIANWTATRLFDEIDGREFYKNLKEVKNNPYLLFDGIAPTMQSIFGQDAVAYGDPTNPCVGNHHKLRTSSPLGFDNQRNIELREFLKQNL